MGPQMTDPEPRIDRIMRLCDEWCAAATPASGGLAIGPRTEQFRLSRNGIIFHDLTHEELQAACVGLARVLLRPGLNTVVDHDHLLLWSWLAQLLVSPSRAAAGDDREVRELLGVCVRAALAPTRPPTTDRYAWQLQRQIDDLIPFHLRWFGMHSHVVLAYLSFPALEGALKLACKNFVDLSGKAVAAFSVPGRRGGTRDYGPSFGRPQCSSLRDLLLLHQASVAIDPLRARLQEIRDHLAGLQAGTDGFDVLYDWRNSSLHGAASYPTIGGTVLTLALLIALDGVKADFETSRAATWQGVEWDAKTSADSHFRSPWSFYPLY
jgi:hypothetical protein